MAYRHRAPAVPASFVQRSLHSLTGLWLVLFLMEHLLTNSQAALWFGEDGSGFVRAVNALKNLPYLPLIEIALLGVPLLLHAWWGIGYLRTAEYNTGRTDGSRPSLPHYPRNHAYTWQRLTAWILLVGIFGHVIQMRFLHHPASASIDAKDYYLTWVSPDGRLEELSKRLGFTLYDEAQLQERAGERGWEAPAPPRSPLTDSLLAVCPSFGVAELLMVRDTFKSPLMILLYTAFVLAACFHAFNGLWSFMITWGATITFRSQQFMRRLATGLMALLVLLGLAAIWGAYWLAP